MKKFMMLLAVLVGIEAALVASAYEFPLPTIDDPDGSKMVFYADVLTLSDGKSYRVDAVTVRKKGEPRMLVADMYSTDSNFAEVAMVREINKRFSGRRYACTPETYVKRELCRYDPAAEALLEEAVRKVMKRRNVIGNQELLWSWELGTKELRDKIGKK
jgi:hypothetical protein